MITPSIVRMTPVQNQDPMICFDCQKPMKDFGYWTANQGRVSVWRCVNRACNMCSIPREPEDIPGLYSTKEWKTKQ